MERKIKVSPSIIAVNYNDEKVLNSSLETLKKSKVELLHLDVMDGKFVDNKTFGAEFVSKMRNSTDFILDTHLMIENPEESLDQYIDAGADIITVHYESTKNLKSVLQKIKANSILAGVSIKPQTDIKVLFDLIDEGLIDLVLVMTVEPGKCGQKFISDTLFKIRKLRLKYPKLDIQVDGGVNLDNIEILVHLGANIVVSGSAIFNSGNPIGTIKEMKSYKYDA